MSDSKLNLIVQFSALDKLSGALKSIVGLGRTGDQAMRLLRKDSKLLKGELADVRQELSKATGNVSGLLDKERQLEAAIAGVNRQMERQKALNKIDGDVMKMRSRASQLKDSGSSNVWGGVGLITPFIMASKAAMDFSSGMVDIQQKAELTNAETAGMARNIIAAARAAHQMPEEMRKGVDTLAGFGLDPRVAMQMIAPIGRLGTAFKVEIADGAAAAFANLNNLKIAATDTARALDIMAAGGNYGAFEVKDMARYFPALTAQMHALGQGGLSAAADLTSALEIARRATGDSESAATNVQDLLAKINAPVTIAAFKKNFGIDLPAALKQAYAQGKTPLEAIAELTKKATGGDLSKIGFAFRNMEAASAVRALIQNMDDYRRIRDDLGKGGGTVDRAFRQRELQDASIQWKSFTGNVSTLAITLGATFLPAANRFLEKASSIASTISSWAQAHPRLFGAITSLIAYVAVAKIGIGALQFAFGSILGPMASVYGLTAKLYTLGKLAPVISYLGMAFNVLAGPVGIAVAVIAGGAYLIYRNWGPISGFFHRHGTKIRNVLLGLLVIFAPFVAGVIWVAAAIYRNWDKIKSATLHMLSVVGGIVAPFLRPLVIIGGYLANLGVKFFGYGVSIVQGLINGIASMTWSVIKAVLDLASKVGGTFANSLGVKSPSRVFIAMGGHITDGLALGLDQGHRRPLGSMHRLAKGIVGAGSPAFAVGRGQQRSSARAGTAMRPIEIHIHQQPGEDAQALARRVAEALEARERKARRSSYRDDF